MSCFFIKTLTTVFVGSFFISSSLVAQSSEVDLWAYDSIHIPHDKQNTIDVHQVIIAVVDDAFRLSHKELKEFIYQNPDEVPGNLIDDDGNGYIDDVHGWDISDHDNDVSVRQVRENEFYHGTFIASIIARIGKMHYNNATPTRIKILPVKVLSDQANQTYLKDGYQGIKYAMENGADIICLAWSGGNPGKEDLKILAAAHQQGILLIGSAGNFNEENVLFPAASPYVLAVGGVDRSFQKAQKSNYGMDVDISAPAEHVMGAFPDKDNAYIHDDGTSASAALVAGSAAILMSKDAELTSEQIKEVLLNTATPFSKNFTTYGGKMGAGIVNMEQAIEYTSGIKPQDDFFSPLRSKGFININADSKLGNWEIKPAGGYQGFYLEPDISKVKRPEKISFRLMVKDSIWKEFFLHETPSKIFVPSPSLKLEMSQDNMKKSDQFRFYYHGKTVDSTSLYCEGIRYLDQEKGSINDGSQDNNYANNCSCKWIITVPPGKRIKFTFESIDTEPNVDFVYLVDGTTAIPSNIIAKFSGHNQPPEVYSKTNEVLVWFVTDKINTGKGWQFHYEAIE